MSASAPVTDGLFVERDDGIHLLGSRCAACGGHHFPVTGVCTYCSSTEVTPVELSREGVLWAFTAVTAAPPGYLGAVPFGFGVVELPEGLRVITLLTESDPARLRLGQPMRLVVHPLGARDDGGAVHTYAFEPAT
jgi:uncharacterized OB-fold protein